MKKLFASIAVVLLSLGFIDTVSAQVNFGVLGGASFSSAKPEDWKVTNLVQYHAGITCCINLPLGFAVQPEVLYHVKGSNVPLGESSKLDYAAGYVEVPVSLQWGPNLLVMRPYFELVPFVGYAVNNRYRQDDLTAKNDWAGLQRWEYGLGLGAGVEVWHFQISARYNWNFGSMFDAKQEITDVDAFINKMKGGISDKTNFGGVTLTLAVLF